MIQLPYTAIPSKAPQHTVGIRSGTKDSQTRSVATLGGDDSGFIGDTTVFDRFFSRPAALARHKSAPLVRERERFLSRLEATGTQRSAIRIAATYLLQVVNILGLRCLRDVTLEEVDRASDHWNTLRNQDKQYPAGQFGVQALRYNFVRICARARIHQEHSYSTTPGMHAILKSTEQYLRLVPERFIKSLSSLQAPPNYLTHVRSHNNDTTRRHFNHGRKQV